MMFKLERLEAGIDDNLGFCTGCGAEHDSCEPDARNYVCEGCGQNRVFGAAELLIMGYAE